MGENTSIKHFLRFLFGSLLFATPIIFVTNTNELFEFPKMFFVYFTGSFIVLVSALYAFFKRTKIKLPSWIVLAFFFASLISGIFSSHVYTSIWGYYTRFNGSMISIFVFVGLYLVAINFFNRNDFEKLLPVAVLPIVPVSIYAILQHFTFTANIWKADPAVRVFSTFGQPNWLAQYLAMMLPIVLLLSFASERDGVGFVATLSQAFRSPARILSQFKLWSETRGSGPWKNITKISKVTESRPEKGRAKPLFTFVYILGFTALWFTYSISGLLGFVVGIGTLLAINREKVKKNTNTLTALLVISILIALTSPGIFKERLQDVFRDMRLHGLTPVASSYLCSGLPSRSACGGKIYIYGLPPAALRSEIVKASVNIEKIAYAAEPKEYNISDPGNIRKGLWKGTIKLIFSSPKSFLIGTGPETFAYAFQPFRPPKLNYTSEWDFVFNKPHNYYLETFSNLGLIGFVPYILIVWQSIKKKDPILTPSLTALYTTNLFGWPTVTTTLVFWIWLAILESKKT